MNLLEAFNINNFTDRLVQSHKYTKSAHFYICPVCQGNSLQVHSSGKYQCFSTNCSTERIRDALRPLNEAIAEAKEKTGQWTKPIRPVSKPVYFQYPNANGNNLVRVKRTDLGNGKKDIKQEWWTGDKWQTYDMPDVVKYQVRLYRIDELINKNSDRILFVEGEPVADLLIGMGIAATTNIGGSGKWQAYGGASNSYPGQLNDKDVVLCPDRDKSGVSHCLQIEKDVDVVQWLYADPTNPEWEQWESGKGYDLKDWIEDLDDRDLAKQLIFDACEPKRHYAIAQQQELTNVVPINSQSIPPQDLDAESFVIGQFLLSRERIGSVAGVVISPDYFYRPLNREICAVCFELYKELEPVDVLSVHQRLTRKGFGDKVSQKELKQYRDRAEEFADNDIVFQCNAIADKYTLRCGQQMGRELAKLFTDESQDPKKLIAEAQKKFIEFQSMGAKRGEFQNFGTVLEGYVAEVEAEKLANDGKVVLKALRTGIDELDEIVNIAQGSIVAVYGRPSQGKTTLTLQVAQNISLSTNLPVLYCSLEISKERATIKHATMNTMLSADSIKHHDFADNKDRELFQSVIAAYKESNLFVYDMDSSVENLCASIRAFAIEHGTIAAIFIDYVQLLSPENATNDPRRDLNTVLTQIKRIRKELNVTIVLLSQLSRGVEARQDKRPTLADGKESGNIEQDCDLILYVYRDEFYNETSTDRGLIEIGKLKDRDNNSSGKVKVAFDGKNSRIGSNFSSILDRLKPSDLTTQPTIEPVQLNTVAIADSADDEDDEQWVNF